MSRRRVAPFSNGSKAANCRASPRSWLRRPASARSTGRIRCADRRRGRMKASDVMTRSVVSVGRGTPIAEAIHLRLEHQVSCLPVLDADGKVVGILTEGDLLRRSETGTERQRPRWLEIVMGPGRIAGEYVRTHGRRVEDVMTNDV